MNGGILTMAISTPVRPPRKAPSPNMTRTPSAGFIPPLIRSNATTVMSAAAEPTERSIPALVITNVIPTAMTMMNDAWVRMLTKLVSEAKRGLIAVNAIASTTMTIVSPNPSNTQRRSAWPAVFPPVKPPFAMLGPPPASALRLSASGRR